jgi:nicotinamide mononucleotide transporter
MTLIELIATLFGLACVWLYIRQSVWSWPTGLVQVCLYAWIFLHARLYSDVLLHLIYIALGIYGWHHWLKGSTNNDKLPIRSLAARQWVLSIVIAITGTLALGTIMARFTNADLPYPDATITVLSLIAQFLIARKVLENWLVWIVVDVLAIAVYAYKGLYITTGLYSVFLVMAATGFLAWRKSYRAQLSQHPAPDADLCSANSSRPTAGISS